MAIPGDLNQDGQLTRADLDILRQLVQQAAHNNLLDTLSPEQKALLDISHDGQIDKDDIEALCKQLLNTASPDSQKLSEQFTRLREKARE